MPANCGGNSPGLTANGKCSPLRLRSGRTSGTGRPGSAAARAGPRARSRRAARAVQVRLELRARGHDGEQRRGDRGVPAELREDGGDRAVLGRGNDDLAPRPRSAPAPAPPRRCCARVIAISCASSPAGSLSSPSSAAWSRISVEALALQRLQAAFPARACRLRPTAAAAPRCIPGRAFRG